MAEPAPVVALELKVTSPLKLSIPALFLTAPPPKVEELAVVVLLVNTVVPFNVAVPLLNKAPPFVVAPLLVKVEPPDKVNVEPVSL